MKIEELSKRWEPELPLLRCPKCGADFTLERGQFRCGSGHCYDLSAKGYVNLAPSHDQKKEKYDASLFEARSRIFADGFYRPVLEAVCEMLERRFGDSPFTLADVGCGEGYYCAGLARRFPGAACFGVDLSRDGIQRAARNREACWMVADLKRLPFRPSGMDVVLDVLTPADYQAFSSVLSQQGVLIKAIPGADYLKEIRALFRDRLRNPDYDNERVIRHLEGHGEILEHATVRCEFPLDERQSSDSLCMTPMTFSIPEEIRREKRLEKITVHMEIYMAKVKG